MTTRRLAKARPNSPPDRPPARRESATGDVEAKLAAVRAGARHAFPAPDVDQMLDEIERGYIS